MFSRLRKILTASILLALPFSASAEDMGTSVSGLVGFGQGGIGLGADYEMTVEPNVGWGGMFRYYSGLNDLTNAAPKIFFFGAFVRPHWNRGNWDFYFSPGIGFSMAKLETPAISDSETLITPILSLGTAWAFSDSMSLGVETTTIYGITDDDWRGPISVDYMVKLRVKL